MLFRSLLCDKAVSYVKALEEKEKKKDRSIVVPGTPIDFSRADKLVSVKNLTVKFKLGHKEFSAVNDVTFDIHKGETLSLVGESGSGKTTIGKAILKINHASSGQIFYKGVDITGKLSKHLCLIAI